MLDDPQTAAVTAAIASAVAAVCGLGIALLSAWTSWHGPQKAAEVAERLRAESEKRTERDRLKKYIFFTLMQERAAPNSIEGVKALNSIDVVFHDVPSVREAWTSLYHSYDPNSGLTPAVQRDRLVNLLRTIAGDVGLYKDLRLDDFSRIYYPASLADEQLIRSIQRETALKHLTAPQSQNGH